MCVEHDEATFSELSNAVRWQETRMMSNSSSIMPGL